MIDEARNKGRKVHYASLMDLRHLKNSELELQYLKYKGRVVLRGDIVKDDSGSFAVFTEQGSSVVMALETCQILGQVSHNLLYWKKKLLTEICGPGGD